MNDYYRDIKNIELAPDIPKTVEGLRDFFKVQLDCPLPIRYGEKYHYLNEHFIWLWKNIAWEHSIDVEAKHIYWDDESRDIELDEDRDYELRPLAISLATWIEKARAEFKEICKPILATVANSEVYEKHFLRNSLSQEEIKRLAIRNNVSYLLPEINEQTIEQILQKAVAELFQEVILLKVIRFSVILNKAIGVTNRGEITNFMMIDINGNSGVVHAYPCSEFEANNNIKEVVRNKEDELDYDSFFHDEREDKVIKLQVIVNI